MTHQTLRDPAYSGGGGRDSGPRWCGKDGHWHIAPVASVLLTHCNILRHRGFVLGVGMRENKVPRLCLVPMIHAALPSCCRETCLKLVLATKICTVYSVGTGGREFGHKDLENCASAGAWQRYIRRTVILELTERVNDSLIFTKRMHALLIILTLTHSDSLTPSLILSSLITHPVASYGALSYRVALPTCPTHSQYTSTTGDAHHNSLEPNLS